MPDRPTDISTLDIYGVRLGMSGEEVAHALRGRFGEKVPLDIRKANGVFKRRVFDTIAMQRGDYSLEVTFQAALPETQPQPEQVSRVELKSKGYAFEGDSTKQRGIVEQEFIDAVMAKYPPPDGFKICILEGCPTLKQGSPYWCHHPVNNTDDPCPHQETMYEIVLNDTGSSNDVYFELVLENPFAERDVEDYWRTHPKKQHLSSSPFK